MEVWFRSFSFLKKSVICRFQPLILQGVTYFLPFRQRQFPPQQCGQSGHAPGHLGRCVEGGLCHNKGGPPPLCRRAMTPLMWRSLPTRNCGVSVDICSLWASATRTVLRVLNILCAQRGDVLASTIPQLWKPDLHSNEMDQSISGNEMGNRITRWWFQIFFMFTAI